MRKELNSELQHNNERETIKEIRRWQKEKWARTQNCMPWYNNKQYVLTLFCQYLYSLLLSLSLSLSPLFFSILMCESDLQTHILLFLVQTTAVLHCTYLHIYIYILILTSSIYNYHSNYLLFLSVTYQLGFFMSLSPSSKQGRTQYKTKFIILNIEYILKNLN